MDAAVQSSEHRGDETRQNSRTTERSNGMTVDLSGGRALVLGGGGVAGVAWEAGMLAGLGDAGRRLPLEEWPARPLLVTAVDTADGSFVAWDRDSGVPLSAAVMASCCVPCVFPPIDINGRRYMDGGTRSATNADLARGASAVVILEPMAHLTPRTTLAAERRALGAARVVAVGPDQAAIDVFGVNILDQALWKPAFQAGLAQSAAAADEIRAVWEA
jgi:NTE family protein